MSDFEPLIREWDGQAVAIRYDRPTGTWMFVAMHSSKLGMPIGGCRMKTYPTPADGLRDALRLSRGMTCKLAAVRLNFGGGKSVLAVPGPIEGEARIALFRRFGRFLESLRGAYATGIDLGTTPADMAILAEETEWVFTGHRSRPGVVDPGPYTARGVLACMRTAAGRVFGDPSLAGRTVLVQGTGDVGAALARLLRAAGARVLLSDVDAGRLEALAGELGAGTVEAAAALATPCDILAPCAVGGVLTAASIPRLQCRIVAGSANNQLEEDADAGRIRARGILYCPDYIVNAGGAIAYAMMYEGVGDDGVINARIDEIGHSLGEILEEAEAQGTTPLEAASRRVDAVLDGPGPAR